jgi:hypothetical protein
VVDEAVGVVRTSEGGRTAVGSAIFGNIGQHACTNCGSSTEGTEPECLFCRRIGDRSLIRIMREMRECRTAEARHALLARFHAAKGRTWTPRERSLMSDGGER